MLQDVPQCWSSLESRKGQLLLQVQGRDGVRVWKWRVVYVPKLNSHHGWRATSMCRLVIRTPCPDDEPEVSTFVLDLCIITHGGGDVE